MPHTRKAIATEFITACAHGHSKEAFSKYSHPDFAHHNPYLPSDAHTLMISMHEEGLENPHMQFRIVHILQEGDMVAIHSRMAKSPESQEHALVHFFRFSDDKIIEMWDITQALPDIMVNEKGMF